MVFSSSSTISGPVLVYQLAGNEIFGMLEIFYLEADLINTNQLANSDTSSLLYILIFKYSILSKLIFLLWSILLFLFTRILIRHL
jgi:hypothetical protein